MKLNKYEIILLVCGFLAVSALVIFNAVSTAPLNTPVAYYYASEAVSPSSNADLQDVSGKATQSNNVDNNVSSFISSSVSASVANDNKSSTYTESSKNINSKNTTSSKVESVVYTGIVNINTAGLEELKSLNGIGDSLAQRIIDYREQNGPFQSIEDIKNVSGIGEKRYESIKDRISI